MLNHEHKHRASTLERGRQTIFRNLAMMSQTCLFVESDCVGESHGLVSIDEGAPQQRDVASPSSWDRSRVADGSSRSSSSSGSYSYSLSSPRQRGTFADCAMPHLSLDDSDALDFRTPIRPTSPPVSSVDVDAGIDRDVDAVLAHLDRLHAMQRMS